MDADDFSDEASTFGDRLALAREGLGLQQADLAQRIGVRVKTVRDWEQDRSEPRSNRLQMLAGILNVSIMWLMSGQGEGAPLDLTEGEPDAARAEVLSEIRAIRDDQVALARRLSRVERRLRAL